MVKPQGIVSDMGDFRQRNRRIGPFGEIQICPSRLEFAVGY